MQSNKPKLARSAEVRRSGALLPTLAGLAVQNQGRAPHHHARERPTFEPRRRHRLQCDANGHPIESQMRACSMRANTLDLRHRQSGSRCSVLTDAAAVTKGLPTRTLPRRLAWHSPMRMRPPRHKTLERNEWGETMKVMTWARVIISCSRFHHSSSAEIPASTLLGSVSATSKSHKQPAAFRSEDRRLTKSRSLRE